MPDFHHLPSLVSIPVTEHPMGLLASALLLVASATFSGCETSLFSLSAPELNRIRSGKSGVDRTIAMLHAELRQLLPTILFCNMAVNVLIFAIFASMAGTYGQRSGPGAALLFGLVSLFVVVFCGEVFPKQLAISSSLMVARLTSIPVWTCYRTLKKPMGVLNAVVQTLERILSPGRKDSHELREEELKLLVELSRDDGVISEGEYELIDGVVDLPDIKVMDIMMPRVDVVMIHAGAAVADAFAAARKSRHCKLPVLDPGHDDPAGWVDVRDILAHSIDGPAGDTIDGYVRKFRFFSEHDRVDQVLERLKRGGGDLLAVVDERGQVIGFFTMQDVMDEVLGHFGESGAAPMEPVRGENGAYIISGRLSVREWRELFSVGQAIPKSSTVGGLVVSLVGRLARPGDTVRLDNMEMKVLSVRHNRVDEVELRLIPDAPPDNAAGEGG